MSRCSSTCLLMNLCRLLLSCGLALVGCASSRAHVARSALACAHIDDAERLLVPGARILLGEWHGNAESPRFAGELACLATSRAAVRLALEVPADEQPAIDAFLLSPGAASDRAALTKGHFWSDVQDGRRSQAMVELLERLRRLRGQGADIGVVTFDADAPDRDLAMAERLSAAFTRHPRAIFIALTGNLHARKTSGRFRQRFMAQRLVEKGASVTTLDAHYGAGTTWVCTSARPDDCGPAVVGRGAGKPFALVSGASPDGAYDGRFEVGNPSFSPPARLPMTSQQQARAELSKLEVEASNAYSDKRYARCGTLYRALAQRNPAKQSELGYDAACCFALAAEPDAAFAALAEAVEHGLRADSGLEKDPDLAALRADPRWQALLLRIHSP